MPKNPFAEKGKYERQAERGEKRQRIRVSKRSVRPPGRPWQNERIGQRIQPESLDDGVREIRADEPQDERFERTGSPVGRERGCGKRNEEYRKERKDRIRFSPYGFHDRKSRIRETGRPKRDGERKDRERFRPGIFPFEFLPFQGERPNRKNGRSKEQESQSAPLERGKMSENAEAEEENEQEEERYRERREDDRERKKERDREVSQSAFHGIIRYTLRLPRRGRRPGRK